MEQVWTLRNDAAQTNALCQRAMRVRRMKKNSCRENDLLVCTFTYRKHLFLFYFLYTKRRQFIQKKKRQRKTLDIQLHFCVFFTTLILRGLAFVDTAAKSLKLYMNATLSCSVWPHQRWHRPLSVSCSIGRRTPRINDVSWRLQYHVKVHTQMLIHYVKTNKWKNKREREIKMLFFSTEWTGR